MSVKAVEMVRKIRDQYYEETKSLSVAEQIKFVKRKSEKLQRELKPNRLSVSTHLVGSSR